jgi:hypothetical protein
MAPKLAGHGLQLLGYALVFLGLGAVAAMFFAAGSYPTIPLWAFVSGALAVAVPLMIAGGRVNSRGRARVLGVSPEQAEREYRDGNWLLLVYLGLLGLQGGLVAAPLFARATGFVHPSDTFVTVWIVVWMFILCAGRGWITRPLLRGAARRVQARRETALPPASR